MKRGNIEKKEKNTLYASHKDEKILRFNHHQATSARPKMSNNLFLQEQLKGIIISWPQAC
jgi:hypothetical protein